MGKDVVKLSSFIENNRGKLKYLISDRVSIPNSIIRKLNKEDNIVTENLRTVTIENISKNIVMGYYAYTGKDYDKEDIFTAEEAYLIQDILLSSKEDKIYGFLSKTSISLETSKEILRIINILREGKRKEGKTTKLDFLISDLSKKLEDRKLLDKVGVLNEAIKIIEESSEVDIRSYLAVSGELKLVITDYFAEQISYIEKRFLDSLCGKLGINVDIVCMTDESKADIQFVKAYGQYNEVEYCIEEIKNKGINFGEAGIYYTDEIYENFIRAACEKNNIGVTFKKANAGDNEIIRLLIDLVESIEADFSYEILGRLVNNQTATLKHIIKRDEITKEEEINENRIEEVEIIKEEPIYDEKDEEQENPEKENNGEYKYSLKRAYDTLLRRENIGWSKARYEDFLKRHESIGEFSTLNERENIKIQPFKEFLRDFIDIYDEENTAEKTYLNLLEFAKKYSYNNKNKNTYLKALRELAIPFGLLGQECKEDQLSIIKDALVNFKFGQPEEMDKVRAQRLAGRCVAERQYNFIVGLAASYVLQDTANSPVLSDDEIREVLDVNAAYVPLAGNSNKLFKDEIEYLLSTCPEGETTLLYSYYDTLAFKELSPSLFYLTKLNDSKEIEATYKPHKTGYRFNKCLENVENEFIKDVENKSEECTFATGSLSATAFETLVKCPFKYYYQRVLNIAEPDNDYKGETWLKASEKGTFFHRIMELYCKAMFSDKYAGETTFSQEEFDKAYNKALKETEIKVPYISQGRKLYETTEGVLSAVELDAIIKLIKKAPKVVLFQDTKIKLNDKTREQEMTSKIKALNERLVEHNIVLFETLPKRTDKQKFDKENAKKEKSLIILKYSLLARKFYFENLPVKELNNNQLLEKAYELLKDEEVRKYFYNKFKCVYVDEFQDTDPLQESIVWNLTTLGNAEKLKEGKLFVVGDPKQAIYRFRGADPAIYFKVKDRFEQSPYAGVFRLSINYRSNNKLIDYVNDFFADKGILWEEEETENFSSNPGGYEEMEVAEGREIPDNLCEKELAGAYLYLVEDMNTKEADIEGEISDIENEEADTEDENTDKDSGKDDRAAEKIPELVDALVGGKYKIRNGDKGFREIHYSDFLVLFDKHRGMGKYVEEFSKRGIKTQVLGEIELEEAEILNHFLRLYKAIAHSHNKEYRTGAVELLKLKLYEGKAVPDSGLKLSGFEEDIYEAAANNIIDELVEAVKGLSAYGKAAYLAEKFDLFFVGKEQPYTYIISSQTKLQQLIENMFAEDKDNTVAFIRKTEQYISDLLDRELVLENTGTDVVRLMNYHKAKGLQGKIVILPPKAAKQDNDETDYRKDDKYYPLITWGRDGGRGIKGSTCNFMGPEEVKEEAKSADRSEKIRLDYVAKTRAEEVLIFIGDENTEEDVERLEIPEINEAKVEQFAEYERNTVFNTEGKGGIAYYKFNPSGFENSSKTRSDAYKKAKESGLEKFARDEIRPSGNVIGTVLHRALELLIERLGLSTDNENLAVICAKQAVNEFKKDITEGVPRETEKSKELNRYREFLPKAVQALESYMKEKYSKDISDKNVRIYTELPFSFYETNKSDELKKIEKIRLKEDEIAADGAAWINGTADLAFVYGDRAIVFDYKSDLADYIKERESFEKTLEERYTGQLALYRHSVNKLYGIDNDKIELKVLYFKDYGDGLRVYEKKLLV